MLNLETLNQAQRNAVMHGKGPLLVLAGPGSGKTYTITQRIFYLMEVFHIPPEQILVITFTKDAALSMQQRFIQLSDSTYPVHFGTFHSVFYHILKTSNFQKHSFEHSKYILTEHQKRTIILPIMKKYLTREELSEIVDMNQEAVQILSAFSFYKNTDDLKKSISLVSTKWQIHFEKIFAQYERERTVRGGLDFDDMVYECHKLLKKNVSVREYWQNRFPFILMDEFQDINPAQYEVVKLLAGKEKNLFAVGDDDQSIYGFRGSNPVCLQNFLRDFEAEQICLDINYRSCPEIVEASGLVIGDNKNRLYKHLTAFQSNLNDGEVSSSLIAHFFQERKEQDDYLIDQFKQKKNQETIGVLFRTNLFMQAFAAKLNMAGISYSTKEKTTGLFEHFIVRDILAYLRVAIGDGNREDFLKIMNKPSRFISRNALTSDQQDDKITLRTIYRFYLNHTEYPYRNDILQNIDRWDAQMQAMKRMSPFLGIRYLRNAVGYENYLKGKNKENEAQWEEWQEILDWMTTEASNFTNIRDWITYLTSSPLQENNFMKEKNKNDSDSGIMLMTVHASKGLEFDKVYIPECNEKMFPHGTMPDKEACEEERRIFYVAMTRAKKSLELLCMTGTKERPRLPSRFLNPLFREKKIILPHQ